jgi:hypothetical protein
MYEGEQHELTGYSDVDGFSQDHRRAISGFAYLIDGGAISWSSCKQELITLSTVEAEYIATTHAAKEGIWLQRLIGELFDDVVITPLILYCDNQAAITLATTDNYHVQTKHIDIHFHFIRHSVKSGVFKLIYCPTDDMVVDILTKALPGWKVKGHTAVLRLCLACGGVQNNDPDLQESTASLTGLDQAVGPEGTSRVPVDGPKL